MIRRLSFYFHHGGLCSFRPIVQPHWSSHIGGTSGPAQGGSSGSAVIICQLDCLMRYSSTGCIVVVHDFLLFGSPYRWLEVRRKQGRSDSLFYAESAVTA